MIDNDVEFQLDTNILVHGVRGDAVWQVIKGICDPLMYEPKPSVCIVTNGELHSFAQQHEWGDLKRNQMNYLLSYFRVTDRITPAVIDAYALIDSYSHQEGVTMGKNDIWIAATAYVSGATLVTTDKDFDHLEGKFLSRIYIAPTA